MKKLNQSNAVLAMLHAVRRVAVVCGLEYVTLSYCSSIHSLTAIARTFSRHMFFVGVTIYIYTVHKLLSRGLSHLAPCLIGGAGTQERRLEGKIHGQAAPSGGRGRASALGGRASQEPQYLRQEAAGRCGSPCRATNPQRCLAPQSQAGRSVRQGASVSGMVSGGVCLGERGVEKVCPNHLRLTYTECRSRSSKNYRHASSDMGVDAVFAALGPFHSISSCTVPYLVLYLILDSIAISLSFSLRTFLSG